MALISIPNVKIQGICSELPSYLEFNSDLNIADQKELELLINTIGINERRIANPEQSSTDLSYNAAKTLLEKLNWEASSIDILIYVSQTPDYLIPGSASQLQNQLGARKECMCMDINQGCAGYVYGLSCISSYLSYGKSIKRGLLIVSDTITKTLSENDYSTIPIFSDAGSATALEFKSGEPEMHFNLQTDGSGYQTIITDNFGFKENNLHQKPKMKMNGHEVFTFGLREVSKNINETLGLAGWDKKYVDYVILHQANKLLNEGIMKKLEMPDSVFPETLSKYGNTSCATIPVTMASEMKSLKKNVKYKCVLSGFGVGLSWASVALEIENPFLSIKA